MIGWAEHVSDQDQRRTALATILVRPVAAGDLEGTLDAARQLHMRDPGYVDAKRVVEALELLMSQVWFTGAPDGETSEPEFATAAAALAEAELDTALGIYRGYLLRHPRSERAVHLMNCISLVQAALDGKPLPDDLSAVSVPLDDALGLSAFDDVTGRQSQPLFSEPEATMHLVLDDLEPLDLEPLDLEPLDLEQQAELPQAPHVTAHEETTRVAKAGELPLEQLRREMEAEGSDAALDGLLDELDDEPGTNATTEVSAIIPHVRDLRDDGVSLPAEGAWATPQDAMDESWVGARLPDQEPSFAPDASASGGDLWDVGPTPADPRAEAEAIVARGELAEALRIYQELAARSPDDHALWKRAAEIAQLLER